MNITKSTNICRQGYKYTHTLLSISTSENPQRSEDMATNKCIHCCQYEHYKIHKGLKIWLQINAFTAVNMVNKNITKSTKVRRSRLVVLRPINREVIYRRHPILQSLAKDAKLSFYEPRAVSWQSITLPLRHACSTVYLDMPTNLHIHCCQYEYNKIHKHQAFQSTWKAIKIGLR